MLDCYKIVLIGVVLNLCEVTEHMHLNKFAVSKYAAQGKC